MRGLALPLLRRRRPAWLGAIMALALLLPQPASAWLGEGHRATSALAFDLLEQRDPQAIAAILRLMQAHPDRARFDGQLGGLTGRDRDRETFELMAIWPDAVRGTVYDHPVWHQSQRIVSSVRSILPYAFGSAQAEFARNLAVAHDTSASDADRAIALCWVMHIVGDMHQPLHAAMWMSWRFPITDAGGQWAWVRIAPDAEPVSLHRFWDLGGPGRRPRPERLRVAGDAADPPPAAGRGLPGAGPGDRLRPLDRPQPRAGLRGRLPEREAAHEPLAPLRRRGAAARLCRAGQDGEPNPAPRRRPPHRGAADRPALTAAQPALWAAK